MSLRFATEPVPSAEEPGEPGGALDVDALDEPPGFPETYVLRPPRLVNAITMIRNTPTAAAQIHGLEYQVVVVVAVLAVSFVETST